MFNKTYTSAREMVEDAIEQAGKQLRGNATARPGSYHKGYSDARADLIEDTLEFLNRLRSLMDKERAYPPGVLAVSSVSPDEMKEWANEPGTGEPQVIVVSSPETKVQYLPDVRVLLDALKPFADMAHSAPPNTPDDEKLRGPYMQPNTVTFGDLRRAARALEMFADVPMERP